MKQLWEPFETNFGDLEARFKHNVEIAKGVVQVEEWIDDRNQRILQRAEEEKERLLQKDRKHFYVHPKPLSQCK